MSQLSQHAVVTQEGDFVVQFTSPIPAYFRYRSWATGFNTEVTFSYANIHNG
ncbi:hypothetical protein [Oceanisphaera pacifica]|uniref:Uncharacterized protein n=1 Tax=Oceanisphaera pacifica TaxID=2818389 RepID=A0ABS3NFR6_9GAMM|nr:hypothetical protein [Oceanisphaera pacifica]MBO1519431.1 hypothetical protein [Oceanisphaera pacifica]